MTKLFLSNSRVVLAAMLFVIAVSKPGFTQQLDAAQVKAELESVLHQRADAIVTGNDQLLRSFLSPSFKMKLSDNRIKTLQDMQDPPRLIDDNVVRTHTSTIKSLKWQQPVARLVVRHTSNLKQTLADGAIREVFTVAEQQESWIRVDQQWKLELIENISTKDSATFLNGKKISSSNVPVGRWQVTPNESDRSVLESGFGMLFIYRMNDKTLVKVPVFYSDTQVARMTGGSFLKMKLTAGKHTVRSDKGTPLTIDLQAGQIVYLVLDMEAGFPRGRGVLTLDESALGPLLYKSPREAKLNPLGADNIDDPTLVMN